MKYSFKLRFQAQYFRFVTTAFGAVNKRPDAYGGSNTLENLVRNSAGRCAIERYGKCVIVDRKAGNRVVKVLKRTTGGITISEPATAEVIPFVRRRA